MVISGELDLVLDGGEGVRLRPGNSVGQRGTMHAWRNIGPEPCVAVAFMVGAELRAADRPVARAGEAGLTRPGRSRGRQGARDSAMPMTGEYGPSPRDWVREQADRFERSGGAEDNTFAGLPVVLMTCVGATSGKLREAPLMRVEHDGEYAAVASSGGRPEHPAWYRNPKRRPRVELQDGPVRGNDLAREATGQERARWWERAVAAYPPYAEYQAATTREIPLFVLTSASGR